MESQQISTPNAAGEVDEVSLPELRVYRKRWYVLVLFCLLSTTVAVQLVMFEDGIKRFEYSRIFQVFGSLNFTYLFLLFTIPGGYLLHNLSLLKSIRIVIGILCIGVWMHCIYGRLLPLVKGIFACHQVLLFALPLQIADVWFPQNQISTIAAVGVATSTLQLFTLIPTVITRKMSLGSLIEYYSFAIPYSTPTFFTILFMAVMIYFPSNPPKPPSCYQWKLTNEQRESGYLKSLKAIMSNSSYLLLLLSTGLIIGVMFPIMNYDEHFLILENYSTFGYVMILGIVSGIAGILFAGIFLNKLNLFKYYKLLCILIFFAVIEWLEITPCKLFTSYIVSSWLGFAVGALYLLSIQLGIELTYPEPPTTSAVLLNATCLISGEAITYLYRFFIDILKPIQANAVLYQLLLIAVILLFRINYTLRRLNAEKGFKTSVYKV